MQTQFETAKCVVLNATYEPINTVPSKRALVLIQKGKAVVLEEHPKLVIRSEKNVINVPVVVALTKHVRGRRIYSTPAGLTQKNLYVRDNYTCQYCGRHRSEFRKNEKLTRDHIIPESKGGQSTWTNLVTACSTCNGKKANLDLDKSGLTLLKKPVHPSLFDIWVKKNRYIIVDGEQYELTSLSFL